LEWRPFDPQSYRDYALALEDNGNIRKLLILFIKSSIEVIRKNWQIEILGLKKRFDGANELISRHKDELNTSKINEKLIANLPVDVRVALNWNKDNTDIDLWVTDPNGENVCTVINLQKLEED
jgi:hypothetical protein